MLGRFLSFSADKISKNLWLYFIIIVLIHVSIKIIHLDFSPFWYDEIVSVQSASLDFGHIKHVSEWDKNPPFYYYCLSVWIKLFNDSEFSIRLLSVFFSSISAGILFLFANNHINKRTAIISSLLFISSNFIYFYAHEARAYSLVLLLSLLSSMLFFKINTGKSKSLIFIFGLINFLLIYTHYITGIIIMFQLIFALIFFEKQKKIWFAISCLITTSLVFLRFTQKQFSLIIDFNSSKSSFWLKKSDLNYLKEVLSEFLFGNELYIILLLVTLIGFILALYKKQIKNRMVLLYCFCLAVGSIFILYFLGKITPIFLDRYLIFTIPFLFILIAYGLSNLKPQVVLPLIIVFVVWQLYKIDYKTDKGMNYRDTVSFIKSFKQAGDLVIVKTKDIKPLFCYYFDKDFLRLKKQELPEKENIVFCNSWEDVSGDVSKYQRVIVIDSFQDYNTNEAQFVANLSKFKTNKTVLSKYKGVRISFYI